MQQKTQDVYAGKGGQKAVTYSCSNWIQRETQNQKQNQKPTKTKNKKEQTKHKNKKQKQQKEKKQTNNKRTQIQSETINCTSLLECCWHSDPNLSESTDGHNQT